MPAPHSRTARPRQFGRRVPRPRILRRRSRRRGRILIARLGRWGQALLGIAAVLIVLALLLRLTGVLPEPQAASGAAVGAKDAPIEPPPRVASRHAAAIAIAGPAPRPRSPLPAWRRYAAASPASAGRGRVVIVIDDLGLDRTALRRLAAIRGPLTLAFLPYAPALAEQTGMMRAAGHELLVHLPMEPKGTASDPGPMMLSAVLPAAEFDRRLDWNLSRFVGFVGVNNHMGSRLTEDPVAMHRVMRALAARGLLFLDSRTTPGTVAEREAVAAGLPHAARDVFLDNEHSAGAVRTQLAKVADLARRRGLAVAIGHPHAETLDAISRWLPAARRDGLVLVPLSAAVRPPATPPLATAAAARR